MADDAYEQLPPGIVVPDEPNSDDSQRPSELPEGSEEPIPESSQGTLPPPGFPIEDASYDPFDE